ncbi:hypothetical protein GCM10010260_54400 [Streptomyces filipinensis]|uniref:Uncharacterized protein n=1 Tax=Streptomyces filipinensis TaxID=66887 RepID=A0A918MCL4_9ACTN|nr:hypothetical protein GCM10010260_54400 [Streptomyces filipinensis]
MTWAAWGLPPPFRGLFLSHHHLGLGMGGMERVAVFPLLTGTLAVGARGMVRRPPRKQDAGGSTVLGSPVLTPRDQGAHRVVINRSSGRGG